MIIIILKPNKSSYDLLKFFRPIVLLNTLGKLIEKAIGERLQFQVVMNKSYSPESTRRIKVQIYHRCGHCSYSLHPYRVDQEHINQHSSV